MRAVARANCSRTAGSSYRAIREKSAADWLAWEDAVISNEPNGVPGMYSDLEVDAQITCVRIRAHFFGNGAWLDETNCCATPTSRPESRQC